MAMFETTADTGAVRQAHRMIRCAFGYVSVMTEQSEQPLEQAEHRGPNCLMIGPPSLDKVRGIFAPCPVCWPHGQPGAHRQAGRRRRIRLDPTPEKSKVDPETAGPSENQAPPTPRPRPKPDDPTL